MPPRLTHELRRLLGHPRAPLVALVLILLYSLGARAFYIGEPCSSPCTAGSSHTLIFDEAYYVNAARVIDGIRPPAGAPYAAAPLHKDPNAEHPQLAKLIIAAGIEVFGDDPWGWRIGSVIFSLIAILALYALVRGVGGSPWLAVGTGAVMGLDNLMLVHGRIATLDIYFVAMALVAAALYVHGRLLPAGLALGVAACMKLEALALVPALALFEAFRVAWARGVPGIARALRRRALALTAVVLAAVATTLLGVWVMDLLVPGYDPGTGITYAGSPFTHIAHMLSYAAALKAIPNATGISSTPWQWLVNQVPIDYARVAVNSVAGGKTVASAALFTIYQQALPGFDRLVPELENLYRYIHGRAPNATLLVVDYPNPFPLHYSGGCLKAEGGFTHIPARYLVKLTATTSTGSTCSFAPWTRRSTPRSSASVTPTAGSRSSSTSRTRCSPDTTSAPARGGSGPYACRRTRPPRPFTPTSPAIRRSNASSPTT